MTIRERIGLSFVIGQNPRAASAIVAAAILAEKSGFFSVFMPEHYYDRESPSILGAIAQSTSNLILGTGVINPYTRYPSLIAMTAATLDEVSHGRVILGLGSGGVIGSPAHGIPNEFAGQKFEHPLGHLEETTAIVRRLLSGDTVTFQGKYYSLKNVRLAFKPFRSKVPIYFGQQGPRMMELAGRMADGVLITLCCTIPYVKDVIRRIEASERAANRARGAVDFAARIITSISKNPRKAVRHTKQLVGRVFMHPGAKPVMDVTGIKLDVEGIARAVRSGRDERLNKLVPDEVVHLTTASGSRRDVRERIEEYRAAGVTHPLIVPIGRNYAEIIKAFSS